MTSSELTKQAFMLYDNIRINRAGIPVYSAQLARLQTTMSRAFFRYKRRLKSVRHGDRFAEQSYNTNCVAAISDEAAGYALSLYSSFNYSVLNVSR